MIGKWIWQFIKGYPRLLRRCSFLLFLEVAILVATGIAFIHGTGQQTGGRFAGMWVKQIVWILVGGTSLLVLLRIDYRNLSRYWLALYGGSLLLLVLVLVAGNEINGARSWFLIGPFSLQPSETAKIGLMVALAHYASRRSIRLENVTHTIPILILAAVPIGLIALQPDLGSALTMFPVTMAILIIGGIQKRWLMYAGIAALLAAYPAYTQLSPHQRNRLLTFVNPERDPMDAGWNAHQSLLAVGSGGMTGKGYMQGTQNALGFLPRTVAPSDFVFSVIAEETGFLGSCLLILVFGGLICTTFYIASKAADAFGRYLACMIGILLSSHIYVNIGMTMGMAPIIGIPLPFVSYGGSFMIVMLSCVGILQSIHVRRPSGWAGSATFTSEDWHAR